MPKFPIGVMLNSFRAGSIVRALELAADAGVTGVQMHTNRGEMAPENMGPDQRRAFVKRLTDMGLTLSATCVDQSWGFLDKERNKAMVERNKALVDLALDLGTNIVTTHIGVIPEDIQSERYQAMYKACSKMMCYAHSMGARFAIETGPEPAVRLKAFLDSLQCPAAAVNLDPGNLVMVTGDDPVQAVYTLGDYIVHTHAKDGVRLKEGDVEVLYKTSGAEKYHGQFLLETPLGEGSVNYPRYLAALEEIGYSGYLTIERECGEQPEADIRAGAAYLRGLMGM